MSIEKLKKENTTLSRIPEGAYATNVETFVCKAAPIATTGLHGQAGYGVFVSDGATRTGSYSVTSSQDTYRSLNMSRLSKSGRR